MDMRDLPVRPLEIGRRLEIECQEKSRTVFLLLGGGDAEMGGVGGDERVE